MSFIQDISINMLRGTKALKQKGFGLPLIVADNGFAGHQSWEFTEKVTEESGTKFVDGKTYKATVTVDGTAKAISVAGASATKIADLIKEINKGLGGAATASFNATGNGSIKIVSASCGSSSSVAITDGSSEALFATLPGGKAGTAVAGDAEKYAEYGSLSEMALDFGSSNDAYKMAAAMFAQEPSPETIAVYNRGSKDIAAALTAVQGSNPDFYAILIPEREKASLKVAGDWANANKKFFFGCCNDVTALDNRNVDREAYIIHDKPEDFPECAWAGQNLPKDPGSITWKWKSLNGQSAAGYTTTQLNTIRADKGQALTEIAGVTIVNEGVSTSGEFIDVIRGQDWIKARMEENLSSLLISNEKVAMDNVGIAQVESTLRSVLKEAGERGIIAKATTESELKFSDDKEYMYNVKVPTREEISSADKAARVLPNVEFVYYLAGAVH